MNLNNYFRKLKIYFDLTDFSKNQNVIFLKMFSSQKIQALKQSFQDDFDVHARKLHHIAVLRWFSELKANATADREMAAVAGLANEPSSSPATKELFLVRK